MNILMLLTATLILLHAVLVVRSRAVSADTILASIVALLAFNGLLALSGLTIGSLTFLGGCMAVIWAFEGVRRPRVGLWHLPGGIVIGVGVMRQPIGVSA